MRNEEAAKTGDLRGSKLLILGGTWQQTKLVEAARELGASTLVVDYLEDSPAKGIADESALVDIVDTDSVIRLAREKHIDGALCAYIDPAQRPYSKICEALHIPCYGTQAQFFSMTDKSAFKRMCLRNGVDVIPGYAVDDARQGRVPFPVFVKPVDSRGSRGQSICRDHEELAQALATARSASENGGVVVEEYMEGAEEFQVTYFFVNGAPHLIRTADSYTGSEGNGLEKVVLGAVSPSQHTEEYIATTHPRVVSMLKGMGFTDGPAFMQGFYREGAFFFFDPGLRFPGVDYERIIKRVFGLDLAKMLVHYALAGHMPNTLIPEDVVWLDGRAAAVLFPTAKPGRVFGIDDSLSRISLSDNVVSCLPRISEGDVLGAAFDVNQRIAEIDIIARDADALAESIRLVQSKIAVWDERGRDAMLEVFDPSALLKTGCACLGKSNF